MEVDTLISPVLCWAAKAPTLLKEALADAYERLAVLSPARATTTPEVQGGASRERGGRHGKLFV